MYGAQGSMRCGGITIDSVANSSQGRFHNQEGTYTLHLSGLAFTQSSSYLVSQSNEALKNALHLRCVLANTRLTNWSLWMRAPLIAGQHTEGMLGQYVGERHSARLSSVVGDGRCSTVNLIALGFDSAFH